MTDRPAPIDCIYAVRNPDDQGEHFMRHMDHMTREGLRSKAAIASELAHRDIEIEKLKKEVDEAEQNVIAYAIEHTK